jgi:predicted NAD/FAD-binding protein
VRLAIIGAGISGLTSAWLLQRDHEIVLYEANDQLGGHAHTVDVETDSGRLAVDTGFIVFNRRNYPGFTRILDRLQVAHQPAEMSFSVRRDDGFEYGGASLDALFARRSNLLRPSFLRMCLDIPRFYREARHFLRDPDPKLSLGEFVADRGYSRAFAELHLFPMCAAIWSTDPGRIEQQPAANLLHFLDNHGLLQLRNRPQWFSISGGSRSYVAAMAAGLRDSIRLRSPVLSVRREWNHVEIRDARGQHERFHHVVIATHSDQALALLSDPSDAERQILGAIRYQPSEAVLHCDTRLLPRSRRAWSSWNYHVRSDAPDQVRVTYLMNRLQRLESPLPVCVTLNETEAIDPARIFQRLRYEHPLLDPGALHAQAERAAIDGVRRTHYCGAYWGYGFHEDGVRSALDVCRRFGAELP